MMRGWHVYIDGASLGNPGRSGAGIVSYDEQGNEVWRESIHLGTMTNNMAEYEALVRALRRAREMAVAMVFVYTDSELVAKQVLGSYRVKNDRLRKYLQEAQDLIADFNGFEIKHIPREKNGLADKLAKSGALQQSG
jgi:ribonuclease HI